MPAKPTEKQARAMQLIREGEKPTVAMRKAGYTPQTAKAPKQNLLSTPGTQSIIETYKAEYLRAGITPSYMATKSKELMEAEMLKTSLTEPDQWVPDNKTRLEAWKEAKRDMGLAIEPQAALSTTNILVLPAELIDKYGVTQHTERSSER